MRENALVCIILAAIALGSYGEAAVSFGASAEASLAEPVSVGIEPFLKGTGSLTAALTDELSALADASTRLGYGTPGQGFTYFGFAAADLSYRSGTFFGKLGATSTVEGDVTGSLPDLVVGSDVEMTLDFSVFTLSLAPTVRWKQSDTQRRLEGEGALSSIISAGDQALLRARLEGGVAWPDAGTLEWFAAASAGVSFYMEAPLVLSIDGGFRRSIAANSLPDTIDGALVTIPNANGSLETFLSLDLSASLGRDLRLGFLAPVRLPNRGSWRRGRRNDPSTDRVAPEPLSRRLGGARVFFELLAEGDLRRRSSFLEQRLPGAEGRVPHHRVEYVSIE